MPRTLDEILDNLKSPFTTFSETRLAEDVKILAGALEMVLSGIGGASDIDHWLAQAQEANDDH